MICDDELHIVNPLALKSRKALYEVVTAEDAWSAIKQQQPDLLITDILMPELDGFGLVSRIRDNELTCQLPVIFLTATAIDKKTHDAAERLGVSHVMSKPYSSKRMLALAAQPLDNECLANADD